MVNFLITGDNRNPALFLSQIDAWQDASRSTGIPIQITYSWIYGDSRPVIKQALLDKGVRIQPISQLHETEPTWRHQAHALDQLLNVCNDENFGIKSRPDVYLSPGLVRWLLSSSTNWPKSSNPNLEFKIWTPWAHTFYPFLLDDKAFAGKIMDLRGLARPSEEPWRRLFADFGKEAHVRKWVGLFPHIDRENEFIAWFENFNPNRRLSDKQITRINQLSLGDRIYKNYSRIRLSHFIDQPTLHQPFLDYLRCVDETINFFETFDQCSHAFIDKWGPAVDAFTSRNLELDFFIQRDFPWVLYSSNGISQKVADFLLHGGLMDLTPGKKQIREKDFILNLKLFYLAYNLGMRRNSLLRRLTYKFGLERILNSRTKWSEAFFPW